MLLFLLFGAFSLVAAVTGQDGRISSLVGVTLFGRSVALSDDGKTLVTSGYNTTNSSAVLFVYSRPNATWAINRT